MRTRVLLIITISLIGVFLLLCCLAKMGMKTENSKKTCDNICRILMIVALFLIGVSQINDENEGYDATGELGDSYGCLQSPSSKYGCEKCKCTVPLSYQSNGCGEFCNYKDFYPYEDDQKNKNKDEYQNKINKLNTGKEYLSKLLKSVKKRKMPVDILEKDVNKQYKQWEICSLLEQCLLSSPPSQKNKNNGLPLTYLNDDEKFWLFRALYYFLPLEGFSYLLENISSSEILDEIQIYGQGTEDGLMTDTDHLNVTDTSYPIFGDKNNPHLVTGYREGHITTEYSIHPRGLINKFIKIFGDLNSNHYGFRYSGHHFDINIQVNNGSIKCLPVFKGYNPLKVPVGPTINQDHHQYKHATFSSLWSQSSGIDRAPMISIAIENLTKDNLPNKRLLNTKYNTGYSASGEGTNIDDGFIGLTKEGIEHFLPKNKWKRNIYTFNSSSKQDIWNLVRSTLDIVTKDYNHIKNDILNNGQFGWFYNEAQKFTYFRIESDKYSFQSLLNKEFSVHPKSSGALHYHSRFCDKHFNKAC